MQVIPEAPNEGYRAVQGTYLNASRFGGMPAASEAEGKFAAPVSAGFFGVESVIPRERPDGDVSILADIALKLVL